MDCNIGEIVCPKGWFLFDVKVMIEKSENIELIPCEFDLLLLHFSYAQVDR